MRCAKCRAVIPTNDLRKDGENKYQCYCAGCNDEQPICGKCENEQIEECFYCRLKTQENKLDLYFDHIERGNSVENCKDPVYRYQPNAKDPIVVCRNLVIDAKFVLKICIEKYISGVSLQTLVDCFNSPEYLDEKNEMVAVFWLPITTTGTFHSSGLIPPISECILLSNSLENHFGIDKDYKAQIVGGKLLNKKEWLEGTFKMQKDLVTGSARGVGQIKAVLSNCKILRYFLIERAAFPNAPTKSMLADCEMMVKLLKNPENLKFHEYVEAVELYLESIKNEMGQGANQTTGNQTSKGGNSNND